MVYTVLICLSRSLSLPLSLCLSLSVSVSDSLCLCLSLSLSLSPVGANRPDILIKDLGNKKGYIIDISCPIDMNVGKKEVEKISKYGPLLVETERMWGVKTEVIPVVVGGLGAVSKNLGDNLAKIPGSPDLYMCQKICLLGSKRILQDVLKRR